MKWIKITLYALLFVYILINIYNHYLFDEIDENIPLTTVKISNSFIDLGEVSLNSSVSIPLVIFNSGQNDLYIYDVQADCHCIVYDWVKEPIKYRDSVVISVEYDGNALGYFQQNINVEFNSRDSPHLFIIRGKLIE